MAESYITIALATEIEMKKRQLRSEPDPLVRRQIELEIVAMQEELALLRG